MCWLIFTVSNFNDVLHNVQVIIDKGYVYCRETPKFESNMIFYLHSSEKLVQLEEKETEEKRKLKRNWREKEIGKRGWNRKRGM